MPVGCCPADCASSPCETGPGLERQPSTCRLRIDSPRAASRVRTPPVSLLLVPTLYSIADRRRRPQPKEEEEAANAPA